MSTCQGSWEGWKIYLLLAIMLMKRKLILKRSWRKGMMTLQICLTVYAPRRYPSMMKTCCLDQNSIIGLFLLNYMSMKRWWIVSWWMMIRLSIYYLLKPWKSSGFLWMNSFQIIWWFKALINEGKKAMGKIRLAIYMEDMESNALLYVIDVKTTYNMLLRWPMSI